MILPRYPIFSIFVSMSTPRCNNRMIYFSLSFSFSLQLTCNHIKTSALVYLDIFVKSSASDCYLAFAYFLLISAWRCLKNVAYKKSM